ncbi:hypothetical protein MAFF211471_29750 [Ralstonia solanacearum]|nr:hypothetical protein MAFF211471_29750 [Ralstonia solanacearum]BCN00447.1 hypothetical protein RPSA_29830 [Ralstonia solanacearum]
MSANGKLPCICNDGHLVPRGQAQATLANIECGPTPTHGATALTSIQEAKAMFGAGCDEAHRPGCQGAVALFDTRWAKLRGPLPKVIGAQEVVVEEISRLRPIVEFSDNKRSSQSLWRAPKHKGD